MSAYTFSQREFEARMIDIRMRVQSLTPETKKEFFLNVFIPEIIEIARHTTVEQSKLLGKCVAELIEFPKQFIQRKEQKQIQMPKC